jgi:hypothetical protein
LSSFAGGLWGAGWVMLTGFLQALAQASFPQGPSAFYPLACVVLGHPRHAFLLMDESSSSPVSGYRFIKFVERNTSSCQHPLAARPQHWLLESHDLHRRCVPRHRWRPWPIAVEAPALQPCACAFRLHSESMALMKPRGDCAAPFGSNQKNARRRQVGRSGRIDAT